ncbi:FMN reductase [Pseudomonas sp. PA15(2017)]|uniref:FMN reductase n=1 Tax=Pseudomonas sp. PA15(2017) TaxID=1932111 RepID=UPI0009688411|nr:FMN reductase [Pseudomonas sp. PA15(2017)]OLU28154.1 FMN reductase [Pseudomonas sp. PA15(2017)]
MSTPFKIVAVSGGTSRPSRTLALTEAIVSEIGKHLAIDTHLIELGNIARPLGGALWRTELSTTVEHELRQIESADLLVVAAPVYRGTYPGLFKHLFDLIGQDALIDTPVLLAASGGSERHALVLDHQLRPLFSFFQSLTLPIGVYASESEFADYRIVSQPLQARIELAAERAAGLFRGQAHALRKIA